jgi:hypothetical protein
MRRWIATAALAALVTEGCYSTRPYKYEGRDSNATVVVYRLGDANLGLASAYLAIDGRHVVTLGNKQYTEIQLAPGEHVLAVAANGYLRQHSLKIDVADLDRCFYEIEPNPARWGTSVATGVEPVTTTAVAMGEVTMLRPFLFHERTDKQFLDKLASLQRRDPASK